MPPGRITMLFGDEFYERIRQRLRSMKHNDLTPNDETIHSWVDKYITSEHFESDIVDCLVRGRLPSAFGD